MKKQVLFLSFVLATFYLSAQTPAFEKQDKALNLGIGFGNVLYSGSGYTSTTPPISASFEIGAIDDVLEKGVIGLGGYVGYSSYKWEYDWWGDQWGFKYSDLIIGARGSLHYPLVDKLDTYTGLLIGYEIITAKEYGTISPAYNYKATSSGGIWSWYLGGRYFFTDNVAAMMELGYGITYLNLGLAVKF